MKRIFVFLVLLAFFFSCNQPKNSNVPSLSSNESDTISTPGRNDDLEKRIGKQGIYKMIDDAIDNGNRGAYNRVSNYFIMNQREEEFLFPAMIMANRNNYPDAYFDVYYILAAIRYDKDLERMDSTTRNMALFYLLKSYEMGFRSAGYEAEEIFAKQNKPIPKSSDYQILK